MNAAGSSVRQGVTGSGHWRTLLATAVSKVPSHCSLKKTRVTEKAHRWSSHKRGNQEGSGHTGVDQVASSTTAVGTHSARSRREPLKLARERLRQTCEVDARQHTIASGSCCCRTQVGSRSFPDLRRESSGATARAQADWHDSKMAHSARERVS
jgi:hypothetical protein